MTLRATSRSQLLTSKLAQAPVPAIAVLRHPLLRRLDAATQKKVTLVAAPAGYGKSVLLGQWSAVHAARRLVWLTIDDGDDDANRFARHLCAALEMDTSTGGSVLGALQYGGERMGAPFVAALVRHSARLAPTVLVIDDLHLLTSPSLLAELTSFVELAAPTVRFVLLARTDPPLELSRLRLDDQVAELRQDDLAFSRQDTAELVRRVAYRSLDEGQLDQLLASTEGWIAGLQLAALSLRSTPDIDVLLSSFSSDDHVAEYLTSQVLQQLDARVRRFLLRTSVLDRLSASLCDSLTGDRDGQQILHFLDHRSLFISRLDNRRGWYRYHPLFRALLESHLRAADPDLARSLLERAADWHLWRDEAEVAVPYLLAASSWDRVVDVVSTYGEAMYREGRIGAVVRWLDLLPPAVRRVEPTALSHALAHTMAGNTETADELLRDHEAGASAAGAVVADVIRTCWVQHHLAAPEARAIADRALLALAVPEPDGGLRVPGIETRGSLERLALLNRGFAEAYDGDDEAATHTLGAMLRTSGGGHVPWDVAASGGSALLAAWAGELQRAEEHGQRALEMAQESSLAGHSCTMHAYLALAHVAREHDDTAAAEDLLDEAAARAHQVRARVPLTIHVIESSMLLLACGQTDEALLRLMRHRAEQPRSWGAVDERLRVAEALVLAAVGDLHGAQAVLALRDHPLTATVAAGALRVAIERNDVDGARSLLARWPESAPSLRTRIERLAGQAVVAQAEGDERRAQSSAAAAVTLAAPERFVRLFLDGGYHVVTVLRGLNQAEPTPYLRLVLDRWAAGNHPPRRATGSGHEALSDREQMVLGYLPCQLSNAAIAEQLCISTNTLKTHLKHIYRKLGVNGRRQAVTVSEQRGLL